ncbi:MAG: TIGR01244 family phosphatase [Alphaproteobacteria bacterium]|nr:TIGR01244 family phosphatase [Alphaproteobacteria bacterium]
MVVNKVTDEISVAPQITVEDVAEIAAMGFKALVCNRPDGESFDQTGYDAIKAAAELHGLTSVFQPVLSGRMTIEDVAAFKEIFADAPKPVLAYCRSGTRCTFLWAFSQAGVLPTGEIIAAAGGAGYDISGMAPALEQLAANRV